MSEENKTNSPQENPRNIPNTKQPEIRINEGFEKAENRGDISGDVNRGFTFELKPQKPAEKPKTDSSQNTSE